MASKGSHVRGSRTEHILFANHCFPTTSELNVQLGVILDSGVVRLPERFLGMGKEGWKEGSLRGFLVLRDRGRLDFVYCK